MQTKQFFISFSSKDSDEATRICKLLERKEYTCFISSRDLVAGEEYAEQLITNISDVKAVVLLLSNNSLESPHVLREVEYAVSKNIPILVYALEKVQLTKSMEYYLMTHQWISLETDRDAKLLEGAKRIVFGEDDPDKVMKRGIYAPKEKSKRKIKLPNIGMLVLLFLLVLVTVISIFVVKGMNSHSPKRNTDSSNEVTTIPDTTSPTPATDASTDCQYKLGDLVSFGSYNNEAINWKVLKINEDNTLYLLADSIITFKIFDSAEGGCYNQYGNESYWSKDAIKGLSDEMITLIRGNNDWSLSNIRAWLNSTSTNVKYIDNPPNYTAIIYNHYDTEAGFLSNFTEEERAALIPVVCKTNANSLSTSADKGYETTEDKVFLLSSEELSWLTTADISLYATPTDACITQNQDPESYPAFVDNYPTKTYYWWLRDGSRDEIYKANSVNPEICEEATTYSSVGACNLGIRPVICVKANCELLK